MGYHLCDFWDFLAKDGDIHCVNTSESWGFSKNQFVNNVDRLQKWVDINKAKNCYINYSPLKTGLNRTNDNVKAIKVIALDIEYENKIKPEQQFRLDFMQSLIEETIIKANQIKSYMLVCSGNGFHLYLPVGKQIEKETEVMKLAMRQMVKSFSTISNSMVAENHLLNCDDRIDLAGILRIPGTMNTSANRVVKIITIKDEEENKLLRKRIIKATRQAKTKMKKHEEIRALMKVESKNLKAGLIPETSEELLCHPLVRCVFDMDLKDVEGWHSTVLFAIQAIVKFSGLNYWDGVQDLEKDINSTWGSSISLKHCSADSPKGPCIGAYKFCLRNGFTEYSDELQKLIF